MDLHPKPECNKTFTLNIELHIRHGTSLMLRSVSWYVSTQSLSKHLPRRPVLEALGMNTSDTLLAAAHRYSGSLNLAHLCTDNDNGRIARLYDSIYHSDRGADDNNSEEDEQWIDLENDNDKD